MLLVCRLLQVSVWEKQLLFSLITLTTFVWQTCKATSEWERLHTIRLYLHWMSTNVVNMSCKYLWPLLLTCNFDRLTDPFLRMTLFLRLVIALVSLTTADPVPPSVPLLFSEYRLPVLLVRYKPLKEKQNMTCSAYDVIYLSSELKNWLGSPSVTPCMYDIIDQFVLTRYIHDLGEKYNFCVDFFFLHSQRSSTASYHGMQNLSKLLHICNCRVTKLAYLSVFWSTDYA